MKILFVAADPKPERWTSLIQQQLPDADIQVWQTDSPSCGADYAIVWHPPAWMRWYAYRICRATFRLFASKTRAWRCKWLNTWPIM